MTAAHGDVDPAEHQVAGLSPGAPLSVEQLRVMRAIERCRTAALGGHVDVSLRGGTATPSCNSCRNRHCPKCYGLAQAKWPQGRKQRILPTHYFHVVFTRPSARRPLARLNPG